MNTTVMPGGSNAARLAHSSPEAPGAIMSWLEHLVEMFPIRRALLIGAGNGSGPYVRFLLEQNVGEAILAEADPDQFKQLQRQTLSRTGWYLCGQFVAPSSGSVRFHRTQPQVESSALDPAVLGQLWPNLTIRESIDLETLPVQELVNNLTGPINWLLIDCLPAGPLAANAIGQCPDTTVIVVRTTAQSFDGSPDEQSLGHLEAAMGEAGFKLLSFESSRNPATGHALFIRDPDLSMVEARSLQQELAETISRLEESRSQLATATSDAGDARTQLDNTRAELADARAQLDDTRAELADARTQLEDTRAELGNARTQLDDTRAQLEDALKRLQSGEAELAALQEGKNLLATETDNLRQSLEALSIRLEAIRLEKESTARKLADTISDLCSQNFRIAEPSTSTRTADQSSEAARQAESLCGLIAEHLSPYPASRPPGVEIQRAISAAIALEAGGKRRSALRKLEDARKAGGKRKSIAVAILHEMRNQLQQALNPDSESAGLVGSAGGDALPEARGGARPVQEAGGCSRPPDLRGNGRVAAALGFPSEVPFIQIESKSLPRSGLHFLKKTLEGILGEDFSFCEWYHEPGCCQQRPCALASYSNKSARTGNLGVRLIKSHDFDFSDPVLDPSLGLRSLVLVRDPLFILTSWFELSCVEGCSAQLMREGIGINKILFHHEKELLADAYRIVDSSFVPPPEDRFQQWLQSQADYITGFISKWGGHRSASSHEFNHLIFYEEIPEFVKSLIDPFKDALQPASRARYDDWLMRINKRPRVGRIDPLKVNSSKVTDFIWSHSDDFIRAATRIRNNDPHGIFSKHPFSFAAQLNM